MENDEFTFEIEMDSLNDKGSFRTNTGREGKGRLLKHLPQTYPWEYVCLDIETTGFSPKYDRIIEISALHIKNRKIADKFSSLVRLSHGRKVPLKIQELTGITDQMLDAAPPVDEVIPKFYEFVSSQTLVGHNVNFDINFLYDACKRYGLILRNNYIDTCRAAQELLPPLKQHRLLDVAAYFKIQQTNAHRADDDALVTALCFERMRRLGFNLENPDKYWTDCMLSAVKRAKKYGKHTWELTDEDVL